MRLVAAVVAAAALAIVPTASAAWFTRTTNVRWPSRTYVSGSAVTLYAPWSSQRVQVSLNGTALGVGWNTIDCGSAVSLDRAYMSVVYTRTYVRLYLLLKTGWFCSFPSVGSWTPVTIAYYE
jgi:hypothetical protein